MDMSEQHDDELLQSHICKQSYHGGSKFMCHNTDYHHGV